MVARVNVRLSGSLGSGAPERWAIGLNYGGGDPMDSGKCQTAATNIRDALAATSGAALGTLKNLLSSVGTLTDVDVYYYPGPGGAAASGAASAAPIAAGTGSPTCPPQCAAVITLLTGLPGASYRGRFYWPALTPIVGTDLKSTQAKGAGTGAVTMAAAIQAQLIAYGPWDWGVYSPKLETITPVSAVRSGDVLDTQRRRRDTLAETFTVSQYPS